MSALLMKVFASVESSLHNSRLLHHGITRDVLSLLTTLKLTIFDSLCNVITPAQRLIWIIFVVVQHFAWNT